MSTLRLDMGAKTSESAQRFLLRWNTSAEKAGGERTYLGPSPGPANVWRTSTVLVTPTFCWVHMDYTARCIWASFTICTDMDLAHSSGSRELKVERRASVAWMGRRSRHVEPTEVLADRQMELHHEGVGQSA
ncbi:unnamed protein product [Symbiodinium natans]|uniref:Uncharacterized protein n=1 Tax=Symbiodinium natans TaxID=878477 RepID=A0A812TDX1_9DINO|nr:unnamed protein product [Symbiodinium natans]